MGEYEKWMKRALELAKNGRGWTSPNPVVGAVIIKDGNNIGEGFHREFGSPHAEIEAIRAAGSSAKDATLYVSLEPCCYYGKTPPCLEAIIMSGIREVVVGTMDPNPNVNGEGIRILRNAGLKVTVGVLEKEAKWINRGFFSYIQKKRPWVTLKLGLTIDGYIADITGKSQWITSESSRYFAKQQRLEYDAVMVGMGTVFKDDPSLLPDSLDGYIPYRVVLDDMLNIPYRVKLVSDDYRKRTIVLTATDKKGNKKNQLESSGIHVMNVQGNDLGWINLNSALKSLAEFGITSIYCEGGGQVAGSLVSHRLVDEFQLFISPKIIGKGIAGFSGFMKSLDEAIILKWDEPEKIGDDILIKGLLI